MNVLGLMSGSSLDGLDMALCQFSFEAGSNIKYEVLETRQLEFEQGMVQALHSSTSLDAQNIFLLDAQLSEFLGSASKNFIAESSHEVDLIASHGHTVFHFPESGFTTQLGNGGTISQIAGRDVVCDFRSSDVGAGGLGAPCAPIADRYLFPKADLFLNIGGISNITSVSGELITAFDVSPANQLLNYLSSFKGLAFDKDGEMSRCGKVNEDLLASLVDLNNLRSANPRALDNSWVQQTFAPVLPAENITDGLRTVVEFINLEILSALKLLKTPLEEKSILITGGGAFNKFLMENLKEKLGTLKIEIMDVSAEVINYKEAMLIALMGFLRSNRIPNVLKSVTGATRDTIGGCIYAY